MLAIDTALDFLMIPATGLSLNCERDAGSLAKKPRAENEADNKADNKARQSGTINRFQEEACSNA